MPSERELIEQVLAAYNEKGPGAVIDYLEAEDAIARDFGALVQPDFPNGGEWPGIEGYNEMTRTWLEVWDEFKVIPNSYEQVSDGRWLIGVTQRARSPSGAEVEAPFFYTFKFTDGGVSEFGIWGDRAQAEERLKA